MVAQLVERPSKGTVMLQLQLNVGSNPGRGIKLWEKNPSRAIWRQHLDISAHTRNV